MSATTWLLPVLGGALTTAGGIVTGLQTNRQAMKRDKQQQEHQRQLANDARVQERRERAYNDLGNFLAHQRAWARSVHPPLGEVPPPEPIREEDLWPIETLVTMHGSEAIEQLLDDFGKILQKIRNAAATIELASSSRSPSPELDQEALEEKKAIEMEYRPDLYQIDKAIRQQMKAELAGRAPVSTSPAVPARRSLRPFRRS